jgi:hypothetical protein
MTLNFCAHYAFKTESVQVRIFLPFNSTYKLR